MNARGAKSVQSIMENVLREPPEGLLYFAIFGSQARGTEREDSDLDILYVTKTDGVLSTYPVRRAAKIPGGVEMVTILPYTLEEVTKNANVYGTVEYWVLRGHGVKTLYLSDDFGVDLRSEIDYVSGAEYWLKNAKGFIFQETDCSESKPGETCYKMHIGLDYLLRACLCANMVEFPFTRDMRVLYGMLPPDGRPPMDVDVAAGWLRYLETCREDGWTREDARTATDMARRSYEFAAGLVNGRKTELGCQ